MKLVIVVTTLVAAGMALPPRPFYSARYATVYYQKPEIQPQVEPRQVPQTVYGAPPIVENSTERDAEEINDGGRDAPVYYVKPENQPQKDVPQTVYGDPHQEVATEAVENFTETAERETEGINAAAGEGQGESEKLVEDSEGLKQEAVYYVYHPNGLLQRVVYLVRDDQQNMAYTAQLKYENVEPIREPIYTYDPETFVLQELQV